MGYYKKITRQELEDMVWEARNVLDQKQRDMIIDCFPQGTTSMIKYKRTLYKLYKQGLLSTTDYATLKKLGEKYY